MVSWERLIQATHNYVLALRAIERFISLQATQEALQKAPDTLRQQVLDATLAADFPTVKNLVFGAQDDDLDTISFALLRERAARLRIAGYNKLSRHELIFTIKKLEERIREQVKQLKKPTTGFLNGDGI